MASPPPALTRKLWLGYLAKGVLVGGGAILLLVVVLLIYYVREDSRGASDWAQAKAALDAAGISLDPKTYLAPPIRDAENFGALPIFQVVLNPNSRGPVRLPALDKALDPLLSNIYYPSWQKYAPGKIRDLGNWRRGEVPDLAALHDELATLCRTSVPPIPVPPAATPCDMLGLICPALADLRAANLVRPSCLFDQSYLKAPSNDAARHAYGVQEHLYLARALIYEERLAVLTGEPQLALDDLKVAWKISSGTTRNPLLVDFLTHSGILAMHVAVIHEGLAEHVWNDAQLSDLDAGLGKIDLLTDGLFCLRADFVIHQIPAIHHLERDRPAVVADALRLTREATPSLSEPLFRGMSVEYLLTPSDWYETWLAQYALLLLPGKTQLVDPAARRIYPDREVNFSKRKPPRLLSAAPGNAWFQCVQELAHDQVQIDEARISCRLERYRLAHGSYPASLDALVADYGELPKDIMNGEPYHYQLKSDQVYVLYSVAWNQKDDGGNGGKEDQLDWDRPDWIWTNVPDEVTR